MLVLVLLQLTSSILFLLTGLVLLLVLLLLVALVALLLLLVLNAFLELVPAAAAAASCRAALVLARALSFCNSSEQYSDMHQQEHRRYVVYNMICSLKHTCARAHTFSRDTQYA
jgi:ABC-type bacteriocin/lantibiotic exporter with double-glycine peptidase domain